MTKEDNIKREKLIDSKMRELFDYMFNHGGFVFNGKKFQAKKVGDSLFKN